MVKVEIGRQNVMSKTTSLSRNGLPWSVLIDSSCLQTKKLILGEQNAEKRVQACATFPVKLPLHQPQSLPADQPPYLLRHNSH